MLSAATARSRQLIGWTTVYRICQTRGTNQGRDPELDTFCLQRCTLAITTASLQLPTSSAKARDPTQHPDLHPHPNPIILHYQVVVLHPLEQRSRYANCIQFLLHTPFCGYSNHFAGRQRNNSVLFLQMCSNQCIA